MSERESESEWKRMRAIFPSLLHSHTSMTSILQQCESQISGARGEYKLDFSGLAGRAASGGARDEDGSSGLADSKGTSGSTEASM